MKAPLILHEDVDGLAWCGLFKHHVYYIKSRPHGHGTFEIAWGPEQRDGAYVGATARVCCGKSITGLQILEDLAQCSAFILGGWEALWDLIGEKTAVPICGQTDRSSRRG